MEKIEKLTKQQEAQLITFREECYRKGVDSISIDKERAEEAFHQLYANEGLKTPNFMYTDSILGAQIIQNIILNGSTSNKQPNSLGDSLRSSLRDSLWDSLWGSLRDSLGNSLRSSLRDSLWDSLWGSLRDSLGNSLRSSLRGSLWDSLWGSLWGSLRDSLGNSLRGSLWGSLWDSLWGSLRDSLRSSLRGSLWDSLWGSLWGSLRDSLWDSLRDSLWDSLGNSLRGSLGDSLGGSIQMYGTPYWGQHDYYWIAFYKFPEKYLGVRYQKEILHTLHIWEEIAETCHWWWPFEKMVIISQKPKTFFGENEQLHKDGGAAVEYPDGYKQWYLHGRNVPQWLAETPTDKLDVQRVITINNMEVRMEGIKKIGLDRVISNGCLLSTGRNRNIPTLQDYELYDLSKIIGTTEPAPFLKMINPSTNKVHIEDVHPDCKTVEQAINWRAYGDISKKWEPIKLT